MSVSGKTVWIHKPSGDTLLIPQGLGENLRPLGWYPITESGQEPVQAAPPVKTSTGTRQGRKPAGKTSVNQRKRTLS